MSMLRTALAVVAGLTAQALVFAADEKPKLEGQHQVIAGERDGQPMEANVIKGVTFRFTNDKVVGATKDGTAFLTADYTLDAAKTPCVIVLKVTEGTDKGKELRGLIERKENTIRFVYAGPGVEAPTEFKTKANQAMYTLKVEKP